MRALDSSWRGWFLKNQEIRIMRKMLRNAGISLEGKVIMDAGCGSGLGTKYLLEALAPSKMIAFDYMPEQIALAKTKGLPVDFYVGDMRRLDLPDNCLDACFAITVLHHIPDWPKAVKEAARLLRKGGIFVVEEPQEDTFGWAKFEAAVKANGFEILDMRYSVPFVMRSYLCRKL
ncbi:predicted SAM-dependent methyltransferase [Methanocella arvoryzae MRE50]|uniref:Predicted SAM-dependent methyltransferase n=2 Tax=Methanocella TaxID=570266 RepID=Q0W445_METAR|nr:predicted SAM-dependent methyltransferase [Methanocella arvoryzae MRE50]